HCSEARAFLQKKNKMYDVIFLNSILEDYPFLEGCEIVRFVLQFTKCKVIIKIKNSESDNHTTKYDQHLINNLLKALRRRTNFQWTVESHNDYFLITATNMKVLEFLVNGYSILDQKIPP